MPQSEYAFQDLAAVMPFGALDSLKTHYIGLLPRDSEYKDKIERATLAGLCFLPRTNNRSDGSFQTVSFDVILVYWDSEIREGPDRLLTLPERREAGNLIPFMAEDAVASSTALARPAVRVGTVFSRRGINSRALSFQNARDWAFTLFRYNGTREFDAVFLDIDTFEYLGRDGRFGTTDSAGRGVNITRATFSLPVTTNSGVEYFTFRTLNFAPDPYPQDTSGYATRIDVAFHLGPPCPPWWDDRGVIASSATSQMPMPARRGPGDPQKFCDCPHISKADLFDKMLKGGFVTAQSPEPLNMWPAFLLRLLVLIMGLILLIIGSVKIFNLLFPKGL